MNLSNKLLEVLGGARKIFVLAIFLAFFQDRIANADIEAYLQTTSTFLGKSVVCAKLDTGTVRAGYFAADIWKSHLALIRKKFPQGAKRIVLIRRWRKLCQDVTFNPVAGNSSSSASTASSPPSPDSPNSTDPSSASSSEQSSSNSSSSGMPSASIRISFDDHDNAGPSNPVVNAMTSYGMVGIAWRKVNPSLGVYNWSDIDEKISYYGSHGKKVGLRFVPWLGKYSDNIQNGYPDYIWSEGVTFVEFIDKRGDLFRIPRAWSSPEWLTVYGAFVRAVAERYGNHPQVQNIWIGAGRLGKPVVISGAEGQAEIIAAGFTATNWTQYLKSISELFKEAFPNKPCLLPIGTFFHDQLKNDQVKPYMIDVALHGASHGLNIILDGLDPDQAVWSSRVLDDVVNALATIVLPPSFTLALKDDWPLLGGAKERTLTDLQSAAQIALNEWNKLGKATGLELMLLDDELEATNPESSSYDASAHQLLNAFLTGQL